MSKQGTPGFASYARNLRRLMTADIVEQQLQATQPKPFKASLVDVAVPDADNLAATFEYHRHRNIGSQSE